MLYTLLTASLIFASGMPRHETLTAKDGVLVDVDHWDRDDDNNGPVIVLFHQAGSHKGEYHTIAPRLFDEGYNLVVVSQRSGGTFQKTGTNKTATGYLKTNKIVGAVPYVDALPDMRAAVAFAKKAHPGARVAVWGSSYSAALVFTLAAEDPSIAAVLAFSPGEYLGPKKGKNQPRGPIKKIRVADAAKKVRVPVLIITPLSEKKRAQPIARALPNPTTVVTPKGAVHGSSMLIPARSKTAAQTWTLVDTFLGAAIPVKPATLPPPAGQARP